MASNGPSAGSKPGRGGEVRTDTPNTSPRRHACYRIPFVVIGVVYTHLSSQLWRVSIRSHPTTCFSEEESISNAHKRPTPAGPANLNILAPGGLRGSSSASSPRRDHQHHSSSDEACSCSRPNVSTASAYATAAPTVVRTAFRERRRKRCCSGVRCLPVIDAPAAWAAAASSAACCSAYSRTFVLGARIAGTTAGSSGALPSKNFSAILSQKATRFRCVRIAARRWSLGRGQRSTALK